jgi:GAF domain-containing protein
MSQSASISLIDATTAGAPRRRPLPLSELAVANRQRDALYLLSEELHQADTTQAIHDAAMDAIESALNCDRSAILLLDEAGVMQFVASRGLSGAYRAAVTGHSPWRADECGAVPIDIPDVEHADLDET